MANRMSKAKLRNRGGGGGDPKKRVTTTASKNAKHNAKVDVKKAKDLKKVQKTESSSNPNRVARGRKRYNKKSGKANRTYRI